MRSHHSTRAGFNPYNNTAFSSVCQWPQKATCVVLGLPLVAITESCWSQIYPCSHHNTAAPSCLKAHLQPSAYACSKYIYTCSIKVFLSLLLQLHIALYLQPTKGATKATFVPQKPHLWPSSHWSVSGGPQSIPVAITTPSVSYAYSVWCTNRIRSSDTGVPLSFSW